MTDGPQPSETTRIATPAACLGYVRVSTGMQADSGLSIDEQKTKIRARCVENGWELGRIFVDTGVSGSVPLGRRPKARSCSPLCARATLWLRHVWIGKCVPKALR